MMDGLIVFVVKHFEGFFDVEYLWVFINKRLESQREVPAILHTIPDTSF